MGDTPRIFLQESNVMQIQRHPSVEELGDIFMLDAVNGFGPQKFKDLHKNGISASSVLKNPQLMERFGKRGLDYCMVRCSLTSRSAITMRHSSRRGGRTGFFPAF